MKKKAYFDVSTSRRSTTLGIPLFFLTIRRPYSADVTTGSETEANGQTYRKQGQPYRNRANLEKRGELTETKGKLTETKGKLT